ncbi:MAG: hypothetical protein RIF41_12380 [Polyangiaceae bacterium]
MSRLRRWGARAVLAAASLGLAAAASGPIREAAAEEGAQRYQVKVEMTEMAVDTKGDLTLVVAAQNDWAIDPKFAATLEVDPKVGDDVLVARKTKYGRKDAELAEEGAELRWTVTFAAKKAGRHRVKMKATFQVCRERECHEQISELELQVVVKG